MKKKPIVLIAVIALVVAVAVFAITKNMTEENDLAVESEDKEEEVVVEPKDELPFMAPLTGMPLEEELLLRPLAVTIENSPNARPQSGLKEADVVYEVLAEGGITRFLAIYQQGTADPIGPIRSARHYLAYMTHDFDGVFVHIGGSPQGLAYADQSSVANLNAFYIGTGEFWRASHRRAPHNFYSNTQGMRELLEKRNIERETAIEAWPFLDEGQKIPGGEVAQEIAIYYPIRICHVKYVYDQEKNNYKRYMAEEPHLDEVSEEQLAADNIIVQYAHTNAIPGDDQHRINIDLIGSGDALIFSNGRVYEAEWEKSDKRSRTIYTDNNGEEIALVPGQTWIQIVRTNTEVEYNGEVEEKT